MEVEHVTKGTITLRGRRIHRQSEGTNICDTFKEAQEWIVRVLSSEIEDLEKKILARRERIKEITEIDEASIPLDNEPY